MVDLGRKTVPVKVSCRDGKKAQPKQVEKWVFVPCCRSLAALLWQGFCPHPGGAVSVFTWHCTWCSSCSSSFWPPNQFFPLSFGKKQKVWWGERSNFLLIACLSLSVLPSFQISRSRVGSVLSLLFSLVLMEKNDIFCLDRNQSLPQTPLKNFNLLN